MIIVKKPKIRFKGFTETWEQRKLKNILVSLQNNTLSRADLSNNTGVAKNVHYGDVLIKFGEVLDISKEQLPMITDEKVLPKYKASFLQNGDVVVADTAEDTTVGKCSEIAGLNDEVVISGLHTIPYRPVEKFATGYLGYYLNSDSYHNQLIPLMQGIKVTSISKSAMQDTNIIYPNSKEEQAKIGKYFITLDNLITLHQRKCENLKKLKKFMLQKLFPQNGENVPKIRFTNFTDTWEQRKLFDFTFFYNGLTYTPDDVRENGTLVLRSSNVKHSEIVLNDNVYVDPIKVNSEYVKKGDIIIVVRNGSRALIGKHAVIKDEMPNTVIGAFMSGIRSQYSFFVNSLLDTSQFKEEILRNLGATINQITGYMFSKMEFMIPSCYEQKIIGDYFSKLDNLITLHQSKCDKLKEVKKYMLQNMFI